MSLSPRTVSNSVDSLQQQEYDEDCEDSSKDDAPLLV